MSHGHRLASLPADGGRAERPAVYVQVARGLVHRPPVLTLVDLSPSTIYLSAGDPPEVGYLSTGDFLDEWVAGQRDGRMRDRIHGVLSLLDPAARLGHDAHVLVRCPRIAGSGLAYDVEILGGIVPTTSGACVLYLEPERLADLESVARR